MNRRQALKNLGSGFGLLSLAHLLARTGLIREAGAAPGLHFPAKAKRMVYLCLNGGPSHVDTFDPKPMLAKYDGQTVPESMKMENAKGILMKSPFRFQQHGQSGLEVSEIFPRLARLIDDCCVIRSMHGDSSGHGISLLQMNSGHLIAGHPSMGSWVTYGLGSDNHNLPGFIVLCPGLPVMGAQLWTSGFLPAIHQGAHLRNRDELDPAKLIHYIQGDRSGHPGQRRQLDLLSRLNRLDMSGEGESPELEASIQSMELAFRMQTESLDAFDLRKESQATRERYGDTYFARGCLMARRLLERGVRVVQVFFGNRNPWDSHANIFDQRDLAALSDGPIASLIGDLKTLGLLEDTIVMVGGEFGRMPTRDGVYYGRGHNNRGFSYLMAGGGFQGGLAYGATDDFGFAAVEKPVHIHDLHATLLHQLGLDHTKLTFRHSGRDFRLTDVGGKVVKDIVTGAG